MPPITPVPMARWLAEPAPLASTSGSTPQDEGHRGHHDRAGSAGGRLPAPPRPAPLPCACRSLANSMISIAFFADRPMMVISPTLKYTSFDRPRAWCAEQHAQHAQRHHQDHRQRDRPAFVQRGQAQEHRQQREAEQDEAPARRTAFPRATGRSIRSRSPRGSWPASRSISAIAVAGADSRARLRRRCASSGSRCSGRSASGPSTQRVLAKADSGTSLPRVVQHVERSRSRAACAPARRPARPRAAAARCSGSR